MPAAAPPEDELVDVAGGVLAAELVLVDELAGGELAVDELDSAAAPGDRERDHACGE